MLPITLVGSNLGERHRRLNSAVNDAYRRKQDFNSLEDVAEQSCVDRIFKINLALKLRNVDYIMKNIKDDDMLYVSKALKCKWLLGPEFQHIMNPEYLENYLYTSMITTAVTKMKHWVSLNLKDPERCQLFFMYYCELNFKLSVKFLRNCSADFIKQQFTKHMHKISPAYFKILCEKEPSVAKIFFDALLIDEELKEIYLSKEKQYFSALKNLLKRDTSMVLDISEKYFNKQIIKPFNSRATKFILKHNRTRFSHKPELYTAFLLNLKTLASCLNTGDATDLALTLARDNYLTSTTWFDYKTIEPLIKRIKHEDRAAIKKKIFVDKDVGTIVEKWPYEKPSPPIRTKKIVPIFQDQDRKPIDFRCMLKKRKYCKWSDSTKTMLDKLFDEYRFANFEKVLFELRKKLKAESSAQNRQYMMLVLVSKTGGREKNIASLMELLNQYKNEPPQIRAAIVRSLVKRAQVWRVHDDTWEKFLEFSHGLGLNGKLAKPTCIEGIHAAVIRQLLLYGTCDPKIMSVYFKNFSTLEHYLFSNDEKKVISALLTNILFNKACEATKRQAEIMIKRLLDTLDAFKLSIKKYPGLISKIERLAGANPRNFDGILKRLYESRIARRELFEVNFHILTTGDSYLNALRHNIDVISTQKIVKLFLDKFYMIRLPYKNTKRNRKYKRSSWPKFFRKISIYFNEKDGLAKQFLNALKSEGRNLIFAKALCLLLGDELMSYMKEVDNSIVDIKDKKFAAAIRANIHLARPALDIDKFGWSIIGTKAVANKVLVCRNTEVNNHVLKLRENKRTVVLACLLAKRNGTFLQCLAILSQTKPLKAAKMGYKILLQQKDDLDLNVWNIIKPLIENFNIERIKKLGNYLKDLDNYTIPIKIRPALCIILYKNYAKESSYDRLSLLCHIEYLLPSIVNLEEDFIKSIIQEFLNDCINIKQYSTYPDAVEENLQYIRLIIKYILLCKTEESQQNRYESIGVPFFDKIEIWHHSNKYKTDFKYKRNFKEYLQEILTTFRYYKVFLDEEYVSCIPVMARTLTWIKKCFPIETNFATYTHMHLNMIYYMAIRKSMDILPKLNINDINDMEARKIVGYTFGKHLGREINVLKTVYFDSIVYIYKETTLNLIKSIIDPCEIFTEFFNNGILDEGNVLAVYLFKSECHILGEKSREDILLKLKKCENIEFHMTVSDETFLFT